MTIHAWKLKVRLWHNSFVSSLYYVREYMHLYVGFFYTVKIETFHSYDTNFNFHDPSSDFN